MNIKTPAALLVGAVLLLALAAFGFFHELVNAALQTPGGWIGPLFHPPEDVSLAEGTLNVIFGLAGIAIVLIANLLSLPAFIVGPWGPWALTALAGLCVLGAAYFHFTQFHKSLDD